jgi:hypothetical protein
MKHQLGKITPRITAKALREAEARLVKPDDNGGSPVYVNVPPQDIRERLELFQPRRPGYGLRTLDTKHVNALAVRIRRKGDMDPPLVVNLATANPFTGAVEHEWVVVDGHHRLAAYRKEKHTDPIKCLWFSGSVREAMDASVRRNEKIHLSIDRGDKHEAAWTRTLLDWDGKRWSSSKQEVVTLTGCSDGYVAEMRRVVKAHHNHGRGGKNPLGEKLHTALGSDLSKYPWSKVNSVRLDLSPKQENLDDFAAKLSGQLNSRMPILRTANPEATARALWLFDADLCPKLSEALRAVVAEKLYEQAMEDREVPEDDPEDQEAAPF